jgi:hypothetical protein
MHVLADAKLNVRRWSWRRSWSWLSAYRRWAALRGENPDMQDVRIWVCRRDGVRQVLLALELKEDADMPPGLPPS